VSVFGGIIHRMILREVTKVFLMSLIGITGILLMAGIVAEATQQGLGPGQILAAIPLLVPSTLPYTIPATTLFAACVVYGRLAADNEILAIKAAGVSITRIILPGLILGLTMSLCTLVLYYRVIPYTHHLLRQMIFNDAEELIYTILRKNGMMSHPQMPYSMWVKGVQGRKLLAPIFKRRAGAGQADVVARAREADLRVNMSKGVILIHMRDCETTSEDGNRAWVQDRVWEVPLPKDFGKQNVRRARDMTWDELQEARREYQQLLEKTEAEIAEANAQLLLEGPSSTLPQHVKNLKDQVKFYQFQILYIDVEEQMRPALSFGCLCFIFCGCPVGIWFSRSDYLSSFITCFLPIVLLYYPLSLCTIGIAKEGKVPILPVLWGPNILVGLIGLVLFWRLHKN
jgi:lipopolysaccharide export system permease protein